MTTAKQYLLFAAVGPVGDGGWHDLAGSFESETDAVAFAHKHYSGRGWWWHVVDLSQETIIRSSC